MDNHYSPQEAVDAPRWYLNHIGDSQSAQDLLKNEILLEDGYDESIKEGLKALGHDIRAQNVVGNERVLYGKAQVILKHPHTGVYMAGSDPRSDGCAMPVIF